MSFILFEMTLACTIIIAFSLFVVELNDSLNVEILVALIDMAICVGLTFVYFYFSEWVTSDLLQVGDVFYDSLWYRLPTMKQKLLVLPIQRGGREFRLTGLGFFDCSLAIFSTVNSLN